MLFLSKIDFKSILSVLGFSFDLNFTTSQTYMTSFCKSNWSILYRQRGPQHEKFLFQNGNRVSISSYSLQNVRVQNESSIVLKHGFLFQHFYTMVMRQGVIHKPRGQNFGYF